MNKFETSDEKGIPIKEAMYAGDRECTMYYLASDSPYGQAMAIGACVKHRYTDEETFQLLEALQNSDKRPMGIPVRDLATAALHELGLKKYTGNQSNILWMINDHFKFALEDRRGVSNDKLKSSNN